MIPALILMLTAFIIAILKGIFGAPAIDGVTFLVFFLVLASLGTYYRASTAPRRKR